MNRSGYNGQKAAQNVLLNGTEGTEAEQKACTSLLTEEKLDETSIISITLTDSPDERVAVWQRHVGDEYPAQVILISVGESTRSTSPDGSLLPEHPVSVKSVSSPEHLTELGVRITEAIEEVSDETNHLAVCFHGLTPLLRQADDNRVYQFLHTLTRHLKAQEALAHFHLDPTLFDNQTTATFESLFDDRLSVEGIT